MDVIVLYRNDRPWIYAENKAANRTLERLCDRLTGEFAEEIPRIPDDETVRGVDDALMKANHIWAHRPTYFWAVSPGLRKSFEVIYGENGFRLVEVERIPTADEQPAFSPF
jgi:hypothetical protein